MRTKASRSYSDGVPSIGCWLAGLADADVGLRSRRHVVALEIPLYGHLTSEFVRVHVPVRSVVYWHSGVVFQVT